MNTKEIALRECEKIENNTLRDLVIKSIEEDNWGQAVSAFHSLYECPNDTMVGTSSQVQHMSDERLDLRVELIREEVTELIEATNNRDEVEMADALGDIIYVVVGFALEMGIDLNAVVSEIHASNMTKLGEDGKVIRRSDGKVLKGPNYRRPDIKSVLLYRD